VWVALARTTNRWASVWGPAVTTLEEQWLKVEHHILENEELCFFGWKKNKVVIVLKYTTSPSKWHNIA
jgi:hypothetical protein